MKNQKRDCPDCRTRLQPFWVPARRLGDEVELDRCNDCGGVWFDAGELSDASGKIGIHQLIWQGGAEYQVSRCGCHA